MIRSQPSPVEAKIRQWLLLVGLMQAMGLPLPACHLEYYLDGNPLARVLFYTLPSSPGGPPCRHVLTGPVRYTAREAKDDLATRAIAYVESFNRVEIQDYNYAKKIDAEEENDRLKDEVRRLREEVDRHEADLRELSRECAAIITDMDRARYECFRTIKENLMPPCTKVVDIMDGINGKRKHLINDAAVHLQLVGLYPYDRFDDIESIEASGR